MLRYRGKKITEVVQRLDSFPKIPSDYKEYTGTGGIVSLFLALFASWLVLAEVTYFRECRITNTFVPDIDYNNKLKIYLDMTVATPCRNIGADIVDVTNQDADEFGTFEKENTWFELTPSQQDHLDEIRHINSYLREKYHSLRNIIWRTGFTWYYQTMPKRTEIPDYDYDACRIFGQLELNKVAGNFHVTPGQSLTVPGGHVHLPFFSNSVNLSHRIDAFSFGDPSPGILHPLDGILKITESEDQIYKYFIQVVPTDVDTSTINVKTYQYSVKELIRPVDNKKGSQMAGIFFKYDMNPLKVIIHEEEYSLFQLIIRICGCIGGLYIISGIVKNIMERTLYHYFKRTGIPISPLDE